MSCSSRDFLVMTDLTRAELLALIRLSVELKGRLKAGEKLSYLQGRYAGLIFRKPSLRTRLSFEVGFRQLGGDTLFISSQEIDPGKREPVSDIARVLDRYLDLLIIRTFHQEEVEEFARWAEIPVINALTDLEHPCQVFCDLLTVYEKLGVLEKIKVAYLGDGNNVARSWIGAAHILDLDLWVATHPSTHPGPEFVASRQEGAKGRITITDDPLQAVRNADVVYTDVWASMGEKDKIEVRRSLLEPYRVDQQLMELAPQALIMHCLPAERGNEITDEVIEGRQSVVWDQAENRLYGQLALILWSLGLA